jgi:DNA-directed RNA polymerase subunit RPC12/RpoP
MSEVFTYVFSCSTCGKSFKQLKTKMYQKVHRANKICQTCKKKSIVWVIDNGGEEGKRCKDCKSFCPWNPKEDGWGTCSKGHVLLEEKEYAEDGQVYGLVYFEDICPDFENHDQEDT